VLRCRKQTARIKEKGNQTAEATDKCAERKRNIKLDMLANIRVNGT